MSGWTGFARIENRNLRPQTLRHVPGARTATRDAATLSAHTFHCPLLRRRRVEEVRGQGGRERRQRMREVCLGARRPADVSRRCHRCDELDNQVVVGVQDRVISAQPRDKRGRIHRVRRDDDDASLAQTGDDSAAHLAKTILSIQWQRRALEDDNDAVGDCTSRLDRRDLPSNPHRENRGKYKAIDNLRSDMASPRRLVTAGRVARDVCKNEGCRDQQEEDC